MTRHYFIHLSRPVQGFTKSNVPAVEAGVIGHYDAGVPYAPSMADLRLALPYCYRKALDRSGGSFWFDGNSNDKPAYLTLRDARGRFLNTVYAIPVWAPVP